MLPWRRNQAVVYSGRIPHSYFVPPAAEARILGRSKDLGATEEPPPRLVLQTFLHPTAYDSLRVWNVALDGRREELGILPKKRAAAVSGGSASVA